MRALDFQQALEDSDVKAIWCARGGYGTVRMIDLLNFETFKKQPKWIIGYSDVTVLHVRIQQLEIASLHAPMAFDLMDSSGESQQRFSEILFGKVQPYVIKANRNNRKGNATGVIFGGNLSVVYSLCGADSLPDAFGKNFVS